MQNSLDLQVSELSSRLDIDLANAIKAAKKDASQIQAKVSCLEAKISALIFGDQNVIIIIRSYSLKMKLLMKQSPRVMHRKH